MSVLNSEIGETLEYCQIRHHPKYQKIWEESYYNELGSLCQGIGTGDKGLKKQRVTGTETFRVIRYGDVPANRRKGITYTKVVCEVRPQKYNPNGTRITIGGNSIIYPGDVATPTASLDILKININSALSHHGAKFVCFDVTIFLLPHRWIDQNIRKPGLATYRLNLLKNINLQTFSHNGWVHFEIVRGYYGLPQSGKLANDLLCTRLNISGYFEAATTPGLWRHPWHSKTFALLLMTLELNTWG